MLITRAVALAMLAASHASSNQVGFLGSVDLDIEPAFLKYVPATNELFVSTFYNNEWKKGHIPDGVYVYPIGSEEFSGSFQASNGVRVLDQVWPNEVIAENEVVGLGSNKLNVYSVAGGFILSKAKSDLSVIIDTERQGDEVPRFVQFRVSPDRNKWFYHRALWVDMDGDGHKDLLTARSNWSVPPLLSYKGQVVWFKNPGNLGDITEQLINAGANTDVGQWIPTWEEYLIDNGKKMGGGDTNILVRDLDNDGSFEIIVTHFWQNDAGFLVWWDKDPGPNIVVYALKEPSDGWATASYPDEVGRIVVADDIGPPFDIEFHDINGDGVDELLTSNHEEDGDKAMVIALEIPQGTDFLTKPWKQHILAKGFPNRVPKGMSPGQAQAFYPSSAYQAQQSDDGTHTKPWIIVAGDGTGHAHLLVPKKPLDSTNWEFEERILYDTTVDNAQGTPYTIGAISLAKSEGCTNLYIPAYEYKRIVVYSGCDLENNQDALADQTIQVLARNGQIIRPAVVYSVIGVGAVGLTTLGTVAVVILRKRQRNLDEADLPSHDSSSSLSVDNPVFNEKL